MITCLTTNKKYIGSSTNVYRRKHEHLKDLLNSKHHNSYFQSAFNKYGRDDFRWSILERVEKELLIERETYWIERLGTLDESKGFNLTHPKSVKIGHSNSEETKAILRQKTLDYIKNNPEEFKQRAKKAAITRKLRAEQGMYIGNAKSGRPSHIVQDVRKVYAINLKTNESTLYSSVKELCKKLEMSDKKAYQALVGKKKIKGVLTEVYSIRGHKLVYEDKYDPITDYVELSKPKPRIKAPKKIYVRKAEKDKIRTNKPVIVTDLDGNVVNEFESVKACGEFYNRPATKMSRYLKKGYKMLERYYVKYKTLT